MNEPLNAKILELRFPARLSLYMFIGISAFSCVSALPSACAAFVYLRIRQSTGFLL
jgi:hypothetical protein